MLKPHLTHNTRVQMHERQAGVTAEHVAYHLSMAKYTVYQWRDRKNLPATRVERLWKLKVSEVENGCPRTARMK